MIYVMNHTIFVAPAPGGHREFQQRGPGLGHCGAVAPRGGVDAKLLAQRHGAAMAGMWRHGDVGIISSQKTFSYGKCMKVIGLYGLNVTIQR